MVSIIVISLMTKIALLKTRSSLKMRGINKEVVVAVVKDILIVISITKAEGIMNGTSLESPIMPLSNTMRFSVLMKFGWPFVTSVRPRVALLMLTQMAFMMLISAGSTIQPHSTHLLRWLHSTTPFSNNNGTGTSAPVLHNTVSVPRGGIATQNDLIQVSKSKATRVLCNFQTYTPDADIAALADALYG